MVKAKGTPPAMVRAVTGFAVGVRTINLGEEFPADDELVVDHPAMFEPVPTDETAEG